MSWATQQSALHNVLRSAWTHRGWLAWLLWPLALAFGVLVALRRKLYDWGLFERGKVTVPVIVIGNVVAGGSGKTPVVMALVQHLQGRGLKVGIVSRGYGRRARDCREVLPHSRADEVGDEPVLIRRSTEAVVYVAPHRLDAARALLRNHPDTQIIVCDDGLQHWGLQRDLEVCVFDDRGIGNGFLLPAGPLREAWPRRVDMVLHTGAQPAFSGFTAQRALARYAKRADGSQVTFTELMLAGAQPILAVAAIAKPEEFFAMLRAAGLKLTRTLALPDHCDFGNWSAQDFRAFRVVCTEKDAVKLWRLEPQALAVPLHCIPEPAFIAQLESRLPGLLIEKSAVALSSRHGHTTS